MKYNKGRWISSFKDAMVALRALCRRTAAKARRLRVRYLKAAVQLHPLLAASRPLVFDHKAVAPGARSLRKGEFLEQDHVASIVGSMRAPGWLITMPDWAVKNSRKG